MTMGKLIDLTGKTFGEWEVLGRGIKPPGSMSSSAFWICRCSCGTIKTNSGAVLRQGKSQSCGCKTKELQLNSLSEDLTGKRFGNVEVLARAPRPTNLVSAGAYFKCRCDCRTTFVTMGKGLRDGSTTSCGCHFSQIKDLTNNRFERLYVLSLDTSEHKGGPRWLCRCDCGNIVSVNGTSLKNGNSKSCGCLNSIGESKIQAILEQNDINYRQQYSFQDLKSEKGWPLRFDFAILNNNEEVQSLIEFQGEQHYPETNSLFFDQNVLKTDIQKVEYCQKHGYPLYCIPYIERDSLSLGVLFNEKYNVTRVRE